MSIDRHEASLRSLALQLYLADRYNMDALDTATVLSMALADTVAYAMNADTTIDQLLANITPAIKRFVEFRIANQPPMGLRDVLREFKRTGGKAGEPS